MRQAHTAALIALACCVAGVVHAADHQGSQSCGVTSKPSNGGTVAIPNGGAFAVEG